MFVRLEPWPTQPSSPGEGRWTPDGRAREIGRWLGGFPRALRADGEDVLIGGGLGLERVDPATLQSRGTPFEGGEVLRLAEPGPRGVLAIVSGAGRGEGLATDTGCRVVRIGRDGSVERLGPATPYAALAEGPDGSWVLSEEKGRVRRWDARGTELAPLEWSRTGQPFTGIKSLAIAPGGEVVARSDHFLIAWEPDGRVRRELEWYGLDHVTVAGGEIWMAGSTEARIYDLATGEALGEVRSGQQMVGLSTLVPSPDRRWLLMAEHWGNHALVRRADRAVHRSLRLGWNTSWSGWTHEIAAVTDTHVVLACDAQGWIRSWRHDGGDEPVAERIGINWGVGSLGVGASGIAWTTPNPQQLRLTAFDGSTRAVSFDSTAGPKAVAASPDGRYVLVPHGVFGKKKVASVIRWDDGEAVEEITVRSDCGSVAWGPGDRYAIGSGTWDGNGEAVLRDVGAARAIGKLTGRGLPVVAIRSDGGALASSFYESLGLLRPQGKPKSRSSASSARRGGPVAVGDDDRVYHGHGETVARDGAARSMPAEVTALAAVGGAVCAGLADGQIAVLDGDLELRGVLRGHTAAVTGLVAWGDRLWSGSADGTVRAWGS